MIYFDLIDTVDYLSHSATLSGIQRVQLELARHLSASAPAEVEFAIGTSGHGLRVANPSELQALLNFLDHDQPDANKLELHLEQLRASSRLRSWSMNDTFFTTGLYWSSPATVGLMLRAKLSGCQVGFLCHDIIPLTHADLCPEELTTSFRDGLHLILSLTDFIVANSRHVQHELNHYLAERGLSIPVAVVPLARAAPTIATIDQPSREIAALTKRRFILFVSTIEPRKNHRLTLAIWRKLLQELPSDKVPDLVWAGKHGWQSESVLAEANASDNLAGKLHVLDRVSDLDLRALYRECWFTIFPSIVEGWGLPVAESLAWSKPCLVARTSSIPEVGGNLVWYIDTHDVDAGAQIIRSAIENPVEVEEAQDRIRRHFKPRPWSEVADEFKSTISKFKTVAAVTPAPQLALLRRHCVYKSCRLRNSAAENHHEAFIQRTLWSEGWFPAEAWGRWLKAPGGSILFNMAEIEGEETCTVYLGVTTMVNWRGRELQITCPSTGYQATAHLRAGAAYRLFIDMPLHPGAIELQLTPDRFDSVDGPDPRQLSIGLAEFAVLSSQSKWNSTHSHSFNSSARTLTLTARPIGSVHHKASKLVSNLRRALNI